jgi:hypothetical protein
MFLMASGKYVLEFGRFPHILEPFGSETYRSDERKQDVEELLMTHNPG